MLRTNLFRFIAYTLEGVGQPEGDNPTIYGINKKWHLAEYLKIKKALETDNPVTIFNTVEEVYTEIYEHSVARYFKNYYPLNFNVFDMSFNKGDDDATLCWQETVNTIAKNGYRLKPDGIWGNNTAGSLFILKQFPLWELNNIYGYKRIRNYQHTYDIKIKKMIKKLKELSENKETTLEMCLDYLKKIDNQRQILDGLINRVIKLQIHVIKMREE